MKEFRAEICPIFFLYFCKGGEVLKKEEGRIKQRFNITLFEFDHDYIMKFYKENNISFSKWVGNKILEEQRKQLENDKK